MSTHCMIAIFNKSKPKLHRYDSLIYKHSDGYPEDSGMLQVLFPMLNAFGDDASYLTAAILFFIKKQQWEYAHKLYRRQRKEKREKATSFWKSEACQYFFLGCGTDRREFFHADVRYVYRINLDKKEVLVYTVNQKFWNDRWDTKNMEQYFDLLYVIPFSAKMPKSISVRFLNENYGAKNESNG